MFSGSRSAWRSRLRASGWGRVAAQLTVPVLLGLLVGGVLAFQAGSSNNMIRPVPLGAVATPTPSWGSSSSAVIPAAPTPGWIKPSASATATTAAAG